MKSAEIRGHKKWMIICMAAIACVAIALIVSNAKAFAAIDEVEPNNTKQEANQISMGDTVYGVTSDYGDDDYFRFAAPVSGAAVITLYCDSHRTDGDRDWTYLEVYDGNQNELNNVSDEFNTEKAESCSFGIKSGNNYYIRVDWRLNSGVQYHFSIKYSIGGTNITKTVGKRKAFSIKWNKKAKASFYQIQYVKKSVYQDYGWNRAQRITTSNKSNRRTIKSLQSKRTYFVRVRVARTINGITYYSAWCKKKAVRTR